MFTLIKTKKLLENFIIKLGFFGWMQDYVVIFAGGLYLKDDI